MPDENLLEVSDERSTELKDASTSTEGKLKNFLRRIDIFQMLADFIGKEVLGITSLDKLYYRLEKSFGPNDFVNIWKDKDGTKINIDFVMPIAPGEGIKICIIIKRDANALAQSFAWDSIMINKNNRFSRQDGGMLLVDEAAEKYDQLVAAIKRFAADPRYYSTKKDSPSQSDQGFKPQFSEHTGLVLR